MFAFQKHLDDDEMSEKNTGDFIAKCCLFFTFHDITVTDATFLFIHTRLEIKYFRTQKYLNKRHHKEFCT